MPQREPLGQAAPRRHGHLLAEHRPHGELEAVPGARHAQPGPSLDERREQRVGAERAVDLGVVLIEPEDEPSAPVLVGG